MRYLIAFAGLPGVGKSTVAHALAPQLGATYLRVDSIEAALKRSVLRIHPAEDAGYLAAAAIAQDNLVAGQDVIADTVNPVTETRTLWAKVASAAGAHLLNVEFICSDPVEHRRRTEARRSDIPGLTVPDWGAVQARAYTKWSEPTLTLDTATLSVLECVERILATVQGDRVQHTKGGVRHTPRSA